MSVCRKLPDGTVQKIAGHTILLDANASEVRTGTGHLTKRAGAQFMDSQVTFSDPMPDTDYAVDISFVTEVGISALARVQQKTVTGFKLEGYVSNETDANVYGASGWDFKYVAWKPVKIEGYTELQNKVNNPDETPTEDSTNLCTSGGIYEAIKNASAVWKGTKAEWNALPAADKMKYDLAVLLDKTLVKAVDRETGDETDVADLSGQFVGTHAEWEAESNKTQYKTALLTDERTTVNEVLSTGALNEVADNAKIWRGTKEEWDALTEEERDKWDQAEIIAAPANVDLDFNYSTDETLTGATWIDGKPVYRRVFTNLPISSIWSQHTVDNSSQDSLVSYTILGKSGVSGDTHTTPYFDGAGDYFQVAVVVGAGSINYWGAASSINAFDMVVEYTKTTDV